MLNRLKKMFGFLKSSSEDSHEEMAEAWYGQKSKLMEVILGREHDMVMHAIIPYAIGGSLDLYYYPHSIPGTAIATKELSELPGQGSSNTVFACYELAMFTRHALDLDNANNDKSPFGRAHSNINHILNCMAPYSAQAALNPNDTCEFPKELEHVGGKCLIFDAYTPQGTGTVRDFGILTVIEIFRSEMDFARAVTVHTPPYHKVAVNSQYRFFQRFSMLMVNNI